MISMQDRDIPTVSGDQRSEGLRLAAESARRRYPNILHNPGDEFNRVVNYIMADSYMQPHLHPGDEKIEKIYLLQGSLAVLFFDDTGAVQRVTVLEHGQTECVEVPAFTWHTYVMLSESAITYETMMGQYEPKTWKEFAQWAPAENLPQSAGYLALLKSQAATSRAGNQAG
jgi:cupin fold WbuC family metalloprotein